ncbi:MAG: hypothetical protein ABS81_03210 [Pseudonocardia sp. SCN 72-86]|nr:MAG: hypothetical protein ABS81_03210 [Pseudonocardia sp. SCN 72-86]
MPLLDSHCHLGRYADRDAVIERAQAAEVAVLAATARPSEARDLAALLAPHPQVEVAVGFHPEAAGSVYNTTEVEILRSVIDDFAWVSEVGLDACIAGSTGPDFGNQPTAAAQRELFELVLDVAGPHRGFSVHSRGAAADTVATLAAAGVRHAVMHSYAGDRSVARGALELGFYFSVHPWMLDDAQGRDLVRWLPADRLLLETDGPYYPWSHRELEPADCTEVVVRVAEARGRAAPELHDVMSRNSARIREAVAHAAHDRN